MKRSTAPTLPTVRSRASSSNTCTVRRRFFYCGALWLLLCCQSLFAAPELRLNDHQNKLLLTPYSDILEDEFASWQIDDVRSDTLRHRFRPVENPDLRLKKSIRRYWLRVRLTNPGDDAVLRMLEVSPASISNIAVYDDTGHQPHLDSDQLIRKRALYRIHLPPTSSREYLISIDHQHSAQLTLHLYDDATLLGESDRQVFFGALLIGILTFCLGYCVIGGLVYRDTLFGWHAVFCSLLVIHSFIAFDFIGEPQGLAPPWDQVLLMLLRLSAAICLLLFALRFPIYPRTNARAWQITLQAVIVINFCTIALVIISGSPAKLAHLVLALSGIVLVGSAAAEFFVTYTRAVFYYLCVIALSFALFGIAELRHQLSLTDAYVRDLSVVAVGIMVAVNHAALLIARARARRQRQTDEAQRIAVLGEVNRAKSDILARITHDIRTPMSAMLGVTELLQETRLNASQKDYLRTLQRSCHELIQLLEESGQAARFNDNDVELTSQVFNLSELVSDALSGFRNMAAERALELICDIDPLMGDQLIGDPSRLRQLLMHGLNSAFDHCDDGYILLKISQVSSRPGHIQIDLSHRGKPFTREERQALGKTSRDDSQHSVNARFAIIARLVQVMRGQVSVRATGDIHTLHITVETGRPEGLSHTPTDNTLLRDKRLLLVDDNKTFCDVIGKQCSTWGMSAFSAHNEQAALALMRNQKLIGAQVDFVLIDHRFADNGLQLSQRIHEEFKDKPPVILLLAHANINYSRDQLQRAGVRRVLSKPLGNIALRSALLGESHYAATQRGRHLDQYGSDALSLPSLHCLVAEDNPTNALVLVRMLSGLGITVKHVENGQQAVNNFIRGDFDIVILDIEMPVMDGVEATREIRRFEEEEERERTPIFGLTANALDEQRDRYLQAGMDLHLVKPVRLWELAESIQRWTGYRKRQDEN